MIPNAYPPWILNAKTKEAQYDKCCQNLSMFLLKDTFHSSSCFGLLTFLGCRFQHVPDHNWENWSLQPLIIILLLIVMSLWAHKAEMYIIHYKPVVRQLCVFTSADRCAQSTSSTQSFEDESARVLFFFLGFIHKKDVIFLCLPAHYVPNESNTPDPYWFQCSLEGIFRNSSRSACDTKNVFY